MHISFSVLLVFFFLISFSVLFLGEWSDKLFDFSFSHVKGLSHSSTVQVLHSNFKELASARFWTTFSSAVFPATTVCLATSLLLLLVVVVIFFVDCFDYCCSCL